MLKYGICKVSDLLNCNKCYNLVLLGKTLDIKQLFDQMIET